MKILVEDWEGDDELRAELENYHHNVIHISEIVRMYMDWQIREYKRSH